MTVMPYHADSSPQPTYDGLLLLETSVTCIRTASSFYGACKRKDPTVDQRRIDASWMWANHHGLLVCTIGSTKLSAAGRRLLRDL